MFTTIHFINLLIMAELLLASNLFAFYLNRKEHFISRLTASTLFCLILAFFFPVVNGSSPGYIIGWGMLMYTSFFIIAGCALFLCYQQGFWSILFCITAGQTLQNMSSCVRSMFEHILNLWNISVPEAIIHFLAVLFTYVICWIVFSQRLKTNSEIKIHNSQMLVLSGIAIFFELFLALVIRSVSALNEQIIYLALIEFYSMFTCIFVLCIEFGLLKNKALESELLILNQMIEDAKKQYKMSKDTIQLINIKCHDLKYQIRRLRNSDSEIDRGSLKEIEDAVGIYDSVLHTGNSALDVILTEKCMICEKENIHITCMVKSERINFMNSSDIYSLLGNAIDNAIEAVIKLPEHTQRNISINIRENKNILIIHVENYYSGNIVFKDSLPQTSKNDQRFHGFGMKSMQMIAKKYNGHLTAYGKNDIFHLNILIPIPD